MARSTDQLRRHWPEVKRVFHEAMGRAREERGAFLAQACGDDVLLRAEVESLLAAHDEAEGFLEESALAAAGEVLAEESAEGRRIGPYRLEREIGRGGMGTVFLAERDDGEYEKRVAIKLISRGMDTDAIVHRFRYERQILAELDHPYIARLLDAGATEDGLPYFVMEHVEGEPIDRYCEARHLSVDERLALFRDVCEGVEYAHHHLIVHRDLKPGNIMVTAEGVPKLLDFGLAKVLDPGVPGQRTAVTMEPFRALTPEYTSPEQIKGDAITTASDVYSLGVLLYELLAAHPPYPFETRRPSEVTRLVCEHVPARPSAVVTDDRLRRRLRGDLDNIVGKALRKAPERRYASVAALSGDIARHLEGRPVHARPDTLAYRASKFVKRHKIPVAAAALVVVTLVAGIAATTWQMRVARAERARAEERFEEVRRLTDLLIFDYNDAIVKLPGSTAIRERMISDAFEYLSFLAQEAGDDPGMRTELADGYVKVAEVQMRVGDNGGAIASYRQALAMHGALAAAQPDDGELLRRVAHDHAMLAGRLADAGDAQAALAEHRRGLAIQEQVLARHPQVPGAARDVLGHVFYVGRALQTVGRYDEAIAQFRRMVAGEDSLAASHLEPPDIKNDALAAHNALAGALATTGDLADAVREYLLALEYGRFLTSTDPNHAGYRQAVSRTHLRLGRVVGLLGDHARALEILGVARDISQRLSEQDPSNNETQDDLVLIHAALGDELAALGRTREALASYETSRKLGEEAVRTTTMHARARRSLAATYRGLGDLYMRMGDPARGVALHQASVSTFDSLSSHDPANVDLRHETAIGHERLARALEARARQPADEAARAADRRAACESYARSAALWEVLMREGKLSAISARRPGEVGRALEGCRSSIAATR